MTSICSQTSTMLTFRGEDEVDAELSIDTAIQDIQGGLNQINVELRHMLMGMDRDDSYEELFPHFDNVKTIVTDFKVLLKDIMSITKQLLPPKPKDFIAPMKNLSISSK